MNGLAQIYCVVDHAIQASTASASTRRRHVNAGFFRLWVPKIRRRREVRRRDRLPDLRRGAASTTRSSSRRTSATAACRSVLDFPFQDAVTGYAVGRVERARACCTGCRTTTTSGSPNGVDPTPPTFLGNHDMGRAAYADPRQARGPLRRRAAAASRARLRPALPPPRRAGRLLRRRGRDDRHRRRPGGAAGHVPDAGTGLADAAARRRPADRDGLVVRRDEQPDRAGAEAARRAPRRQSGARRPARRSSGWRRAGCSRSAASTRPTGASTWSCSTTESRLRPRR